jgi:predicted outer membrane repeat protein
VDSTFTENLSESGGGAVYTDGGSEHTDDAIGGTIELCGCRFEGNHAHQTGGGAYLFAYAPDEIIINQCSFEGNVVERQGDGGALGGGLRTGNAPLTLANTLFASNHADVHGGAMWVDGRHLTQVTNCTFYQNDAGVDGQEGGYGGAVSGGNIAFLNVTIAENHAVHSGGAIFNEDSDSVSIRNSILASNTAANEWGLDQSCRDTMQGSDIIQWPAPEGNDLPCVPGATGADPLLGPLTDNGGPTSTMALESSSPAIDAGQDCAQSDQRGMPRSGVCDLGAFEVQ